MTIDHPLAPFERLKPVLRRLFGFYARFMAGAVAITVLIGAYPPIGFIALLLTLGLPILALVLWGRSLDEELGWGEHMDGPR